MTTTVGVLALQGDFAAHTRVLDALGARTCEVRTPAELGGLDGLILPGGESTALLKLMERTGLEAALVRYHAQGGVLFGTCAGMILLARSVSAPAQRSLDLIEIDVDRNAYGRQEDSFEAEAEWVAAELFAGNGTAAQPTTPGGDGSAAGRPLPLVFIRAPRLAHHGMDVTPLVYHGGDVVMARQGRVIVASFHPEISGDDRVHRYLLSVIMASSALGK